MSDVVDDLHAAEEMAGQLADTLRRVLDHPVEAGAYAAVMAEGRQLVASWTGYCRPGCGAHGGIDQCASGEPEYCGCPCGHADLCGKLGPRGAEGLACGLPAEHAPPCYFGRPRPAPVPPVPPAQPLPEGTAVRAIASLVWTEVPVPPGGRLVVYVDGEPRNLIMYLKAPEPDPPAVADGACPDDPDGVHHIDCGCWDSDVLD